MGASVDWRTRYRKPLDAALFPWRLGWATANRLGWLGKPSIGASPHLNPQAHERWRKAIARSRVYLEYGAGGSTVEAARSVPHVISVDTDRRYLEAVERKVSAIAGRGDFHPVHVDIGWTVMWGRPLLRGKSQARAERWRNYPAAPWNLLGELGLVPDFIFIDGRFRAASVLESFLRLPPGADCLFMLDDFDARTSAYGRALRFAIGIEEFDRTIIFRRDEDLDRDACRNLLQILYSNPE